MGTIKCSHKVNIYFYYYTVLVGTFGPKNIGNTKPIPCPLGVSVCVCLLCYMKGQVFIHHTSVCVCLYDDVVVYTDNLTSIYQCLWEQTGDVQLIVFTVQRVLSMLALLPKSTRSHSTYGSEPLRPASHILPPVTTTATYCM